MTIKQCRKICPLCFFSSFAFMVGALLARRNTPRDSLFAVSGPWVVDLCGR